MTSRTSTIPAFKATLVQALTAAYAAGDGTADVVVSYGRPRSVEREHVVVGATLPGAERIWIPLGNRSIEERYDLELFVRVTKPGDTPQEATERAFAIFGIAEAALRAEPTLAVPGVISAAIAAPDLVEGVFNDEGWAAFVASAVRVTARISPTL